VSHALPRFRRIGLPLALLASLWLAGCDQLGIESATAIAAKREADGKAIGAGCRHAARSIEQCFQSNKRADRAAVFAGWREMEDYMRENKIEAVPGQADPVSTQAAPEDGAEASESDSPKSSQAGKGDKAEAAGAADKTAKADKPAATRPAAKSDA
jgi:hypothetical protein